MNNIETSQPQSDNKFISNINIREHYASSDSLDGAFCWDSRSYYDQLADTLDTENISHVPLSSILPRPLIPSSSSSTAAINVPTPSTILCRYFQSGQCRYGALCRFSHNLDLVYPTEEQTLASSQTDNTIHSNGYVTESPSEDKANDKEIVSENYTDEKIVPSDPASWINAPVFVPKHLSSTSETAFSSVPAAETATLHQDQDQDSDQAKSYAQIVSGDNNLHSTYEYAASILCPYVKGVPVLTENNQESYICPYGEQCIYQHGLLCDMCGNYCLHPSDEQQRKQHRNVSEFLFFKPSFLYENDYFTF